jgi:molybdopterin synthase catalytic subunit
MARILYFGIARDLAGTDSEEVMIEAGATVAMFWETLMRLHPRLDAIRGVSRLAVDMNYVAADAPLSDGAEIAIIPPVAGG